MLSYDTPQLYFNFHLIWIFFFLIITTRIILWLPFTVEKCGIVVIFRLTLLLCFTMHLFCTIAITRQTIYNQREIKWALLHCEKSANSCSLTISHNLHAILYEIQNTNNQTIKRKGKSLIFSTRTHTGCKTRKQMTLQTTSDRHRQRRRHRHCSCRQYFQLWPEGLRIMGIGYWGYSMWMWLLLGRCIWFAWHWLMITIIMIMMLLYSCEVKYIKIWLFFMYFLSVNLKNMQFLPKCNFVCHFL